MSKSLSEASKVIEQYCAENPAMPNRTLARKIMFESNIGKSLESIRERVRAFRGLAGKGSKRTMKRFDYESIKLGIPQSDAQNYVPFKLPDGLKKGLLMSDTHLPYHDIDALTYALEDGYNEDVDFIILNGDIIDCYQLSSFKKDPLMRSFKGEIDIAKAFFTMIREMFPKAYILYKFANHEARLNTYLFSHAQSLVGVEEMTLDKLLDLKSFNIHHVSDKRIIQAGKLSILHGDEYCGGQSTPIGPARVLFMKAHDVACCGHWHRTSEYTERSIMNKTITCWSIGCLCNMNPDYSPLNNWNHGYAILHMGQKGAFTIYNKRIGRDHNGIMMRF